MAIDSLRLLTDSAASLWRGLSRYGTIETLPGSNCFDEWIGLDVNSCGLNRAEEQRLRRDYRLLWELLSEIETLARSRNRAVELVQAAAAGRVSAKVSPP